MFDSVQLLLLWLDTVYNLIDIFTKLSFIHQFFSFVVTRVESWPPRNSLSARPTMIQSSVVVGVWSLEHFFSWLNNGISILSEFKTGNSPGFPVKRSQPSNGSRWTVSHGSGYPCCQIPSHIFPPNFLAPLPPKLKKYSQRIVWPGGTLHSRTRCLDGGRPFAPPINPCCIFLTAIRQYKRTGRVNEGE